MRKLAVLVGEEMLKFRHGEALYNYCPDCKYADITPMTNQLGCTVGDQPDVQKFSQAVEDQEADPEKQFCPGYVSRQSAAAGVGEPRQASMSSALLVKQIPSEIESIESDDGFLDDLLEKDASDDTTPAAKGMQEKEAFFQYLKSLGIKGTDEGSAKQLIGQALSSWKDGLLQAYTTPELVDSLYAQLQSEP